MRIHEKLKQYTCDTCTFFLSDLKDHEIIHGRKKAVNCNVCKERFSTKSEMKRHVARVHERKISFKCNVFM